jgi:hypothetical protein
MRVWLFLGSILYVCVATFLTGHFLVGHWLGGTGAVILPGLVLAPVALFAGILNVRPVTGLVTYAVLCAAGVIVGTLTTPGESFFDLTTEPAWYTPVVFVVVFTLLSCLIYVIPTGLAYIAGRALRAR